MITPALVTHINPNLVGRMAELTATKLWAAAADCQIITDLRVRHWLAQLAHESSLVPQEENLNYSAKRILQVWPSRFKTLKDAQACAMRPEALANKVYAGRMGNTRPGDGFKYRGRGLIQLTGRANYTHYGTETGFDLVNKPDLLLQIGVSAIVAARFWADHGLNRQADLDNVEAITQAINGGVTGLQHRRDLLEKIRLFQKKQGG